MTNLASGEGGAEYTAYEATFSKHASNGWSLLVSGSADVARIHNPAPQNPNQEMYNWVFPGSSVLVPPRTGVDSHAGAKNGVCSMSASREMRWLVSQLLRRIVVVTVALVGLQSSALAQAPKASITIDRIAEIKYPENADWSPNGELIAFLWDAAGKQDLFVVRPGSPPRALTDFPVSAATWQSDLGAWQWLSDDRIVFTKDGRLWTVSVRDGRPERLAGIEGDGAFDLSTDRQQIAYVQQGQILVAALAAPQPVTLTRLAKDMRAAALQFSRDNRHIAFLAARSWTDVHPLPFNGTRLQSMRNVTADRAIGVISVHGGSPLWFRTMGDASIVGWTAEGELVFEEISPDKKTRTIRIGALDGSVRTVWSDHDPAWWSPTRGPATVVSPDGSLVAFFSDRSGWTHLYVAPTSVNAAEAPRQLTRGPFTTGYPAWSPDSRRLAYGHGEPGNQMERLLSAVDVRTGRSEQLVSSRGMHIFPVFSPDGQRVLYQRAAIEHSLELYVAAAKPSDRPAVRLTDSMPDGLDTEDLTAPEPVRFPSRVDGKLVPSTLIVSKHLDRTRKHPAIVWIHGSGSDQNYLGWHPGLYRMYYSVHQYLAQQGYVILTPDYRGSSGYDREWATGNYLDLGGKDLQDVVSGADYLRTLDYVDPDRIGVWGLSYGGFMTLQAMTVTPTVFQCAIDVAGVTDWAPRGGGWTVARMGTPAEHPDEYHRSAPVKHMERLERPLLVLHGTADVNVAFHDSLSLFDTLVKLGKPFEMAIYPGEAHFFRRAHVLRDAWRRVEEFFDRHLKLA